VEETEFIVQVIICPVRSAHILVRQVPYSIASQVNAQYFIYFLLTLKIIVITEWHCSLRVNVRISLIPIIPKKFPRGV
jgi:hypothetical protein